MLKCYRDENVAISVHLCKTTTSAGVMLVLQYLFLKVLFISQVMKVYVFLKVYETRKHIYNQSRMEQ